MKNTKALLLCLALASLAGTAAADSFTMHVSPQRFLDKDKNTIINVDYQIPYGNLWFLAQKGGYFAELNLQVEMVVGDQVIYSQTFRDNVGISDKNDARSNKSYLNRLTFSVESEPYLLRLNAKDINSRKTATWTYQVAPLGEQDLLSDLELCSYAKPDSSSFLERFHRGGILYQTQPSLIFDKTESEDLTIYFETYKPEDLADETGLLVLTVSKDSVMVFDQFLDYIPTSSIEGVSLRIPLEKLNPGKYTGSVEFQLGE
ncbi:MAG TPA: hypothetical protein P5516_09320, partial [Anaerolineaceae bacterium]|nr:hypothetical protein [Anaerolineaceae bacterium]